MISKNIVHRTCHSCGRDVPPTETRCDWCNASLPSMGFQLGLLIVSVTCMTGFCALLYFCASQSIR